MVSYSHENWATKHRPPETKYLFSKKTHFNFHSQQQCMTSESLKVQFIKMYQEVYLMVEASLRHGIWLCPSITHMRP